MMIDDDALDVALNGSAPDVEPVGGGVLMRAVEEAARAATAPGRRRRIVFGGVGAIALMLGGAAANAVGAPADEQGREETAGSVVLPPEMCIESRESDQGELWAYVASRNEEPLVVIRGVEEADLDELGVESEDGPADGEWEQAACAGETE